MNIYSCNNYFDNQVSNKLARSVPRSPTT